jgi:hypothetical protein
MVDKVVVEKGFAQVSAVAAYTSVISSEMCGSHDQAKRYYFSV